MDLYLVFGSCDGFGNDCFLSGIFKTEEEAKACFLETYYYGKPIKERKNEKIYNYKDVVELVNINNLDEIESAGIYKIKNF